MNSTDELEYIRNQLAWIKSKVELDNQLGLYDINKLGEDIFMHMLNDVYDLNLQNANDILHDNFPSIDLVDETNKRVIQVTSTKTLSKAQNTVKKLEELKFHKITDKTSNSLKNSILFFRQLKNYEEYQLSFLYLHDKPNINTNSWRIFLKDEDLDKNNFIGIDDIISVVQSSPNKCHTLYKTIQQRMDNISFKFNVDSYFEQAEPHLVKITDSKFQQYEPRFIEFINSEQKILEVYAVGGSGKSHLLRYFSNIETEYIPLVFTKQINIEEDLKKLDSTRNYLFIFDDIDRFLDSNVLVSLLSYTLFNKNVKLLLTYRTASKNIIEVIYRKYNHISRCELEIIWEQEEIENLIKLVVPNIKEEKISKIAYTFNNNPYLITQALKGDMESIQAFSKKIIDDTQVALNEFNLSDKEIYDLLFELSLLSPISKNNITKSYQHIINKLVDRKILRELASKYRFNPDMLGDLYLANYVDENRDGFEKIIENNLKNVSDTVFTNLSYALVYNKSSSLQDFIKNIIQKWIENKEYRNDYLALINKIVFYAPMESFIYLQKATKSLIPKETNTLGKDSVFSGIVTNYSPPKGDWTSDVDAINLESIEPVISKLIYALKNNIPTEELKIEYIIKYLSSELVMNLPKPYYDNQTLDSIFKKLVSPLDTRNFDVILKTLEIMENWLNETPINNQKIYLLKKAIKGLLSATFDTTSWEGINFNIGHTSLNLDHKNVLEVIEYTKNILLKMLENDNPQILYEALDVVPDIGGHLLDSLSQTSQEFYTNIKKEVLLKCIELLKREKEFSIVSKIEDLTIRILRFTSLKTEALNVLSSIERNNEYLFYQIVRNTDVLILNYEEFYNDCMEQENVREWIHENQLSKIKDKKPSDTELSIIDGISNEYERFQQYIKLLNNLNMSAWNSTQVLMSICKRWLSEDNKIFIDAAINHLEEINNEVIRNTIKESLFTEGLIKINKDEITEETKQDDIRIYINAVLKNYNENSLNILQKVVDVSKNKNAEYIRWIISMISGDMYLKIKDNIELYSDFEPFIIQFLDWQLEYNLDVESYITHHILNDTLLPRGQISDDIKNILEKIVNDEEIFIDEFELKPIYEILGYGLERVIENLYNKLTSTDENQKPNHIFTHYFDCDKITEVILLKSYIKSYDDFKILVDKVIDYYSTPVKFIGADGCNHEAYVHLDYFFKYTINKEYLNNIFDEYLQNNDIEKIKSLYTIVPVSLEYISIIVQNLNILEDEVDDEKLMDYLTQVGKIKSWSRSHMQNSDLVLSEESLFAEIYNKIDSLSLQLKLKEELKDIKIQKRQEIEEDIAYLLDK